MRRSVFTWFVLAVALAPFAAHADAFATAARMGRGVNILSDDPIWHDRAKARFQARHFAVIRAGGFQTVRVVLHGFEHMDSANRLDPVWLATVDWVIQNARAAHLMIILDEHDHHVCGTDLTVCHAKLMAFWRQMAARYKSQPDDVLFEILNEPNTKLTPGMWNGYYGEALGIIRMTNPTRTVIVGPGEWNNFDQLDKLVLPNADRNIIVAVHYYTPMRFTHQGASWAPGMENLSGVQWGSEDDRARIAQDFDAIAGWAAARRRPIFVGEFGAYEKGDMGSRVRWASAVARAAEAHRWPWAWWQFDSDFVVYDTAHDRWIEPIHKALVP